MRAQVDDQVYAQVHDQVAKGNVLGRLQCALDLVHGIDAARLFRVQQVHKRRSGAAHLAIRVERRVHRPGNERMAAKPAGNLCHIFATGVVKVLARSKDLNRIGTGFGGKLQQRRCQSLVHGKMS